MRDHNGIAEMLNVLRGRMLAMSEHAVTHGPTPAHKAEADQIGAELRELLRDLDDLTKLRESAEHDEREER
jgi:hypothetical protein